MDTPDVDDDGYPSDLAEVVEQAEAEPEVELRAPGQLEGIQRWLAGEVELEELGIGGEAAAEAALFRQVEALQTTEAAHLAAAAEARAATLDVQTESAVEPPSYAQELRYEATPEGALAEALADAAALERQRAETGGQPEQDVQNSRHEETKEFPEWQGIREDYDGGLRRRL